MITSVADGWARSAMVPGGVSLGGKTGTAEAAGTDPHAWFIGFAPADRPEVAIGVLVVHGGEGSRTAAPIGGQLLNEALRLAAQRAAGSDD
jgi:peptidoglycan glycosyltransferase